MHHDVLYVTKHLANVHNGSRGQLFSRIESPAFKVNPTLLFQRSSDVLNRLRLCVLYLGIVRLQINLFS